MDPPFTVTALHHLQIEIIVFVAPLTERTKVTLLPQPETRGTHRQITDELRNIGRRTTFALQTSRTDQRSIRP